MSHSSHGSGSIGGISTLAPSLGQVLGATAAAAAGSQVLPRTGLGPWVYYLVLASMIAAGIILLSFVVTRVIRFFISK